MDHKPAIKKYIEGLCELLTCMDLERIDAFLNALSKAKREGKHVFIFGNGGAASSASHMAADLNKGLSYGKKTRFRAVCLNDSVPVMLAYANDVSYHDVFVEQLKNFLDPDDLVIGISGSGNSENVLRAIDYANKNGGFTMCICGYNGGKLKPMVKVAVHADIDDMQKTEDLFQMLGHMAYQMLPDE
jgi:D-sedoheptulose 7-phosphate isomerase